MKKSLSPGVVVVIIAVVLVVIGLVFFKGAGGPGGKKATDMEAQIAASRASVNGTMPAAAPKTK
ncbi:MAG: hypothetical protein ACYC27_21800 [Armatimonadota bacterium]